MTIHCKFDVNGFQRFYDSVTGETVHVNAPIWKKFLPIGPAGNLTNALVFAAVNSGALTTVSEAGGTGRLTCGTADNDDAELATNLIFRADKGCSVEAKIAQKDISDSAFNFGFSDATGEAVDKLAFDFATSSLTSNASDAALFFADKDASTNLIRAATVKNDTDGTITSTGTAPVDDAFHTYRVDINIAGDCSFWFDNAHLVTNDAAITVTDALCMYLGLINRTSAADALDWKYISVWGGR